MITPIPHALFPGWLRLFVWLALSTSSIVARAQPTTLSFEHLSTQQGLSYNSVSCMLQDREGFMWFGTEDGLNRFDGYTFLSFEHDPTSTTSLTNNTIRCLTEDRDGNLWVGTENGLNKLDKSTNAFTTYLKKSLANQASEKKTYRIKSIYEDRQGTLWIGTYAGLVKFNKKTQNFTLHEPVAGHPDAWAYNSINTIYEDTQANLWVGTNKGLCLFDRKTNKFISFYQPDNIKDKQPHGVLSILEDHTGTVWVAQYGRGLMEFDRKTRTFKGKAYDAHSTAANTISSNFITTLFEDSFGILWVGTQDAGVDQRDGQTGKFTQHVANRRMAHALSTNTITCVYEDRSKVLWIGTWQGGINKVDLLKKKMYLLQYNPDLADNRIQDNYVNALYEDHAGTIWVGTKVGLDRLDQRTGNTRHYPYSPEEKVGYNTTNFIYEDQSNNLWIGLHGGGLKKFTPSSQTFTTFQHDPLDAHSLPHYIVNTVYQDKKGILWVGTRYGLAKVNEQTKQFTSYKPVSDKHNLLNVSVISIQEVSAEQLLLTTGNDGLYFFDPTQSSFTVLLPDDPSFQQACKEGITFHYQDHTGKSWLGLKAGGLMHLDLKNRSYQFVQQPLAFTKVVMMAMQEDEQGNLWIASNKNGLYQFNPRTKTLVNYSELDGLQSNQFLAASCKSRTGKLYFGGANGLNYFDPAQVQPNPFAPSVAITGFKVLDKPYPFSKELTLSYQHNFFSFDFVALSYALPEKNQYAYQLEGFDPEWIAADSRRYASYTNLDPGSYTFRVKAANHDGVWNKQATAIRITITPPWWRTKLAYLGYVLVFIAAGYAIRYYTQTQERLRNNLKLKSIESDKLQELDQLKSRFFTSISHEFRTPLTLILNPLEKKLANLAHDHPEAREAKLMHRSAHRLLELINQLLDISKVEAGKMNLLLEPGDVITQLKANVHAFFSLAESKGIHLTCVSTPDTLLAHVDKDKLEKIMTNLLSNAIKFTPAPGSVEVTILAEPSHEAAEATLMVAVKDTGIGIPSERQERIFDRFYQVDSSPTRAFEGTGIGLALTKELVHLLKGRLQVSSEVGKGSCFVLQLPLQLIDSASVEPTHVVPTEQLPDALNWRQPDAPPLLPPQPLDQVPLLLLVEDNADLRHYIRSSFQPGYRVLEAVDGEQGLALAQEMIPDLIISDWMMPKMDGRQLCELLKNDERTSHIPLIMLTAKATVESKLEGLQTGADDYLTKPFHAGELAIRAKNLIEQRQRLRQHFSQQFNLPKDRVQETTPTSADEPILTSTKVIGDSILAEKPRVVLSGLDEKFLQRLDAIIEANRRDTEFSIDTLTKEIGMSYVSFHRKLKAVTDQTPSDYIRLFRLRKAAELLSQKQLSVSQVAYEVGISNLSYFTRAFRQVYGMTPSQYAAKYD